MSLSREASLSRPIEGVGDFFVPREGSASGGLRLGPQLGSRSLSNTSVQSVTEELLDDAQQRHLFASVVKVSFTSAAPDFNSPWTNKRPTSSSGTGFLLDVEKRLVVTNAHCVEFAKKILLQREGQPDKYEAVVLCEATQVDIAILTVDDDCFWEGAVAVTLGEMPRLQQAVEVVGYPSGGDGVCITAGVVSRITYDTYCQSKESNLTVQLDAPINGGNSGGPAFSNGAVIGVAFQSATKLQNVGYIIPVSLLRTTLEDFLPKWTAAAAAASPSPSPSAPPGRVQLGGFGRLAVDWQPLESLSARDFFKVPKDESGVSVVKISKTSNLDSVLQLQDVLVRIDGHRISNDGKVTLPNTQPISFEAVCSSKLVGATIKYSVRRAGTLVDIETLVENPPRWYKPADKAHKITYLHIAGLVFSPLGDEDRVGSGFCEHIQSLAEKAGKKFSSSNQQLVLLSGLLPHSVNVGYEGFEYDVLLQINDVTVDNIVDAARAVASAEGTFVVFLLATNRRVVLPLDKALAATKDLMRDFGIPSSISDDVAEALGPELSAKFRP